jgi:spore coat protein A
LSRRKRYFLTRRNFLKKSGWLTAALALPGAFALPQMQKMQGEKPIGPVLDPGTLTKFVDPLPVPRIARPAGFRPDPSNPSMHIPYYRLAMREIETQFHRTLKPARVWGFGASSPGPTIEARGGQGILVEWANELPSRHLLPIDHKIHGAEKEKPEVRAVVHLHGAKAPPGSDGYPEAWYVPGKSALYHYPNRQDAALLWYHDHTLGINRLNVYAGLLGLYVIRDAAEDALSLPAGDYEIPLILCDRDLTAEGQLDYEVSPDPDSPWIPEFFGNATLVNGKLFPYLDVDQRLYRFRVLNGSNARFYNLSLSNGGVFHHIGSDQGLLPAPVKSKTVFLAPGERADVVVDFSSEPGEEIVLHNDTFTIMQFRVRRGFVSPAAPLPAALRPVPKIPESAAVHTRLLTLNEYDDRVQNPVLMLLNAAHWNMPITEKPELDSVEIWSLLNLTDDSHPIHLHLVRFQILDRRPFDSLAYQMKKELRFTGPPVPPDPTEAGWKDTVRADAQSVTRIIARFEGYPGRYIWHCHILEHEDNEMMRPYEVLPKR